MQSNLHTLSFAMKKNDHRVVVLDSKTCPFAFHDSNVMYGSVTSFEVEYDRLRVFTGNRGRWIDSQLRSPRYQLLLTPGGDAEQAIVILDSRLFPEGETAFRKQKLPFIMVDGCHYRGTPQQPIAVYYLYIALRDWGASKERIRNIMQKTASGRNDWDLPIWDSKHLDDVLTRRPTWKYPGMPKGKVIES